MHVTIDPYNFYNASMKVLTRQSWLWTDYSQFYSPFHHSSPVSHPV